MSGIMWFRTTDTNNAQHQVAATRPHKLPYTSTHTHTHNHYTQGRRFTSLFGVRSRAAPPLATVSVPTPRGGGRGGTVQVVRCLVLLPQSPVHPTREVLLGLRRANARRVGVRVDDTVLGHHVLVVLLAPCFSASNVPQASDTCRPALGGEVLGRLVLGTWGGGVGWGRDRGERTGRGQGHAPQRVCCETRRYGV